MWISYSFCTMLQQNVVKFLDYFVALIQFGNFVWYKKTKQNKIKYNFFCIEELQAIQDNITIASQNENIK